MKKRVGKILSLIIALVLLLSFSVFPASALSTYSCVFDFAEPIPSNNIQYVAVSLNDGSYYMVVLTHDGNENVNFEVIVDTSKAMNFAVNNKSTVGVTWSLYTLDLSGNVTYLTSGSVSSSSYKAVSTGNWTGKVVAATPYGCTFYNNAKVDNIDCHFSDCAYIYDILIAANSMNTNIGIVRDNIVAINSELDTVRSNQSSMITNQGTTNTRLTSIYNCLGNILTQMTSDTSKITRSIDTGVDTIVGESKAYESVDSSALDEYGRLESDLPSVNGSDLDSAIDTDAYFTTYSGGFEFWSEKFESIFGLHPALSAVLLFALSLGLGTFIIGRRV